jgi:hypothetical protein
MRVKDRTERNERLSEALRRGDPALTETELAPGDSQELRRAVLNAILEPRRQRRFGTGFAGATAAAALLSLALSLVLWRVHQGDPAPAPIIRPPASRHAVGRPPASAPPLAQAPPIAQTPQTAPQSSDLALKTASRRSRVHHPAAAALSARQAAPPEILSYPSAPERPIAEASSEASSTRQVQFSTPGGTRIIWLLHETNPSR